MISIRRVSALLLCSVMLFVPVASLAAGGDVNGGQQVAETKETIEVVEEAILEKETVEVIEVAFDPQSEWNTKIWLDAAPMAIASEPTIVDGAAYVSLHDFCVALGCTDAWENGGITVTRGDELYIRCIPQKSYILANGRAIYIAGGSVVTDDAVLVPVRVLAQIFNMSLLWDQETRRINLRSQGGVIESAETRYNEEDLYWLAHIISAESRGEPLEGQIAVGNVVLNRVKSGQFPNTVKEVVLDRKNGTQFTPARNGTLYREPTDQSTVAAKLCLEGANTCGNAMYFIATYVRSCWVSRNRPLTVTIGHHNFFN
ncbi:MAG: cell wall hydrolase [Clostridia bacterium]|nr:cell wall hydrolase [Clostridia bacterium]